MKYVKKEDIIDATQWFKLGDHEFVKQYEEDDACTLCEMNPDIHGYLDAPLGSLHDSKKRVCPGDWILENDETRDSLVCKGYICKPIKFKVRYQKIEEATK